MFNSNLSLFIIVMKKVFRSAALLFLCTTMYAQDISQTMSMNLQNVTLKEFFKNLEAQSSFSVVYRDIILSENPDVVVSASNRPLKDILSQVLEKHGLSYKVSNKTIVIVKAEAQAPVKQQKAKKISGVITDETGFPVAGANIVVKGTTNGTISDMDGNFSLEAAPGEMLEISYIGFLPMEVKVDNKNTFDILMKEDAQGLDEVIVVGEEKRLDRIGRFRKRIQDFGCSDFHGIGSIAGTYSGCCRFQLQLVAGFDSERDDPW